jgi:hypothetical protein
LSLSFGCSCFACGQPFTALHSMIYALLSTIHRLQVCHPHSAPRSELLTTLHAEKNSHSPPSALSTFYSSPRSMLPHVLNAKSSSSPRFTFFMPHLKIGYASTLHNLRLMPSTLLALHAPGSPCSSLCMLDDPSFITPPCPLPPVQRSADALAANREAKLCGAPQGLRST